MTQFEPLESNRLEIHQGSNFTKVRFTETRLRLWLFTLCACFVATVWLAWEIWYGTHISGSSSLTLLIVGLVATIALADSARRWFRTALKNSVTVTIMPGLVSVESSWLVGSANKALAVKAIEAVRVVPDAFSRPFRGFPYRRKNHHLCLLYAGDEIHLFKDLSHAEALAVAAAILPGTNCLQLEDHATTPNASPHSNVVSIHEQQTTTASTTNERRIRVAQDPDKTLICLRPHFDWPLFAITLMISINVLYYLPNFSRLEQDPADLILATLMVALLVGTYLRFGANLYQREIVTLTKDVVEHRISRLSGVRLHRYQNAFIREFEITNPYDKVFVDTDFERKSIFQVCFDYGQTTRQIGCRMTYGEASMLRDAMSKSLKDRRQVA